jgi:hypothetical protein
MTKRRQLRSNRFLPEYVTSFKDRHGKVEAAGQSRHDVHQQSLAEIEKVTRIDFGRDVLAADMLAHLGERGAGAAGPITAASDLRFG